MTEMQTSFKPILFSLVGADFSGFAQMIMLRIFEAQNHWENQGHGFGQCWVRFRASLYSRCCRPSSWLRELLHYLKQYNSV